MSNIEKEIWKDVVGYEGLYKVSNLGRIKGIKSGRISNQKPHKDKGYIEISLIDKNYWAWGCPINQYGNYIQSARLI